MLYIKAFFHQWYRIYMKLWYYACWWGGRISASLAASTLPKLIRIPGSFRFLKSVSGWYGEGNIKTSLIFVNVPPNSFMRFSTHPVRVLDTNWHPLLGLTARFKKCFLFFKKSARSWTMAVSGDPKKASWVNSCVLKIEISDEVGGGACPSLARKEGNATKGRLLS